MYRSISLLAMGVLYICGCPQTNAYLDVIATMDVVELAAEHDYLHITPSVAQQGFLGGDSVMLGDTLVCATEDGQLLVQECTQSEGGGSSCEIWRPVDGPVHSFGGLGTVSGLECAELSVRAEAWALSSRTACGSEFLFAGDLERGRLVAATTPRVLSEDEQNCFAAFYGTIPQPDDQVTASLELNGEHLLSEDAP